MEGKPPVGRGREIFNRSIAKVKVPAPIIEPNIESDPAQFSDGQAEEVSSSSLVNSDLSSTHSPQGFRRPRGRSPVSESRGSARGFRHERSTDAAADSASASKQGKTGESVKLTTNYFAIEQAPGWSLYQYDIKIEPEVDSKQTRKALVHRGLAQLFNNNYLYDGGANLFSAAEVEIQVVEVPDREGSGVFQLRIDRVAKLDIGDPACIQVYNVLLKKCLGKMNLQPIGRMYCAMDKAVDLSAHHLKLIPGFITSIRNHENSMLLCVENTTKVVRTDSVLDHIKTQQRQSTEDSLIGSVVLTPYNNKTYFIAEIDWNANPSSLFPTKGGAISYVDYYRDRHGITIQDLEQPLLITKQTKREFHKRGGGGAAILVPELCQMTGLTNEMRSNFVLMKGLGEYLHLSPRKRIEALQNFITSFHSNEQVQMEMRDWGFRVGYELMECPGRILPREKIVLHTSHDLVEANEQADWTSAFKSKKMKSVAEMKNWIVIVPQRSASDVEDFIKAMSKVGFSLGFPVPRPAEMIKIPNLSAAEYNKAIESTKGKKPDLVFLVLGNDKPEIYSSIKKILTGEMGTVSQCILSRNLKAKAQMSIATKILIQINAKLGGEPWAAKMPLKDVMVIGLDVYGGTPLTLGKNVSAMVATVTSNESKYYSTVSVYDSSDELPHCVAADLKKCIEAWNEVNHEPPSRIFFYRCGVSDGALDTLMRTEVVEVQHALQQIYEPRRLAVPKCSFIVVNKKINTRLFTVGPPPGNPRPGTVCDDVITLPERYDFYLVPQSARQGAISPTAYNVVWDTTGLDADKIQRLTYKLCHLYYNWSGTVAVPAPCQYARKLGTLVSTATGGRAHPRLAYKLHFL